MLRQQYGVAANTVDKAVNVLRNEGLVRTVLGLGIFPTHPDGRPKKKQDGEPVKTVSERLGHASVTITLMVYAHVMPGDQERAASRFAALVGGAR